MPKINNENLEKALDKKTDEQQTPKMSNSNSNEFGKAILTGNKMSREQEVAFHQGALNTLLNERNEFFKIIQNVEGVMQAHIKRLEELGVKIQVKKEASSS